MQIAPIPTLSEEINDIRLRTADIVGNRIIPNEKVIYSGGEKSAKIRKEIRKEIIKYLSGTKYYEIGDRKKAIQKSIDNCGPGEIVLIAGKGHETTQDYGKRLLPFSDRSVIKNAKNKSFSYKKAQIYLNNELIASMIGGSGGSGRGNYEGGCGDIPQTGGQSGYLDPSNVLDSGIFILEMSENRYNLDGSSVLIRY